MRVKAYELVDREYKGRGKGLLKVIRFTISFSLLTDFPVSTLILGEGEGM